LSSTRTVKPDFERAQRYALDLLERLSPDLYYHSASHTRDDVVPATERLALLEGVDGEQLLLIRIAAWFHDLGFVEQRADHEAVSARIAAQTLSGLGFNASQVKTISGMILATRLPQTPHNHLESIVADADLDVLGREDFLVRGQALRKELAIYGSEFSDKAWYANQLKFLQTHHYFTHAAQKLRGGGKQHNMEQMITLMAACK
jgi:uncharacterized protein